MYVGWFDSWRWGTAILWPCHHSARHDSLSPLQQWAEFGHYGSEWFRSWCWPAALWKFAWAWSSYMCSCP